MKHFLVLTLIFFSLACTRVIVDPPEDCEVSITYTNEVKEIIDNSCAYSGCHIDNVAPGDYSTYDGLKATIDNGKLQKRMLEIQNMPPEYAPDDKPKSLTAEQKEIITCWVQNEYAE